MSVVLRFELRESGSNRDPGYGSRRDSEVALEAVLVSDLALREEKKDVLSS
jgi:hypothetical protein